MIRKIVRVYPGGREEPCDKCGSGATDLMLLIKPKGPTAPFRCDAVDMAEKDPDSSYIFLCPQCARNIIAHIEAQIGHPHQAVVVITKREV